MTTKPNSVLLTAIYTPDAMLLKMAVSKTELALRSLTEHQPPILNMATHGLLMALEHVNTLTAIEQGARAKGKHPAGAGGDARHSDPAREWADW